MHLTIFGATGPTGHDLLQEGLSLGYTLTAFARNPTAVSIEHERLHVVRGDVFDTQAVEEAITGSDAVISVLGSAYSFKTIHLYSVGTANILQAMQKQGLHRFLCTSSGAANPRYDPREGVFFGLFFKRTIGRTLYADMGRMEEEVMKTPLDWTIVRPARLIEMASLTPYRTGTGYMLPNGTKTSRKDLADFLLQEVQKNQYIQQAVAIATDENNAT